MGDKPGTEEERTLAQEQSEWLVEWRAAGLVDLDGPPRRSSTSASGGWLVVHARRLTEKGRRVLAAYGPPPVGVVRAVEGRIAVMLEERRSAFAVQYRNLRDEGVRHGATQSSRHTIALREIVRVELTTRAREAARFWSKMALEKGWQPTIVHEAVVRSSIEAALHAGDELREPLRVASGRALYRLSNRGNCTRWLRNRSSTVDLRYARSRGTKTRDRRLPHYGDRININAPVGAVQTGQGAVANVEMTWNSQVVESLRSQLSALRTQVAREGANLPERQAVEDVVDLAVIESNRDEPSVGKLTKYLTAAAVLVQTAGAMPEAYRLLKVIAGLVHVQLP